jgi:predicted AlkP superfamily phosphohydrolase/phosphomutase
LYNSEVMERQSNQESYVGKLYVDDTQQLVDGSGPDSAQSDKSTVVRRSELPENTRIIGPDTMVTMDYNEDRLNLTIDENNIVVKERHG